MDDIINSAGTMIVAVLETAGFVNHANILKYFDNFFYSAGAFCYIVAIIGAVISVALFGSYRMGTYLLLAPSLFWFVLNSRSGTNPVVWKIGGGQARSIEKAFHGDLQELKPRDKIEVAFVFRIYTEIINSFTRTLADAILQFEDDEDLLMLPRRQVVKILRMAMPQRSGLLEILDESLFGACEPMMSVSIAMSDKRFGQAHRVELERAAALGVPEAQKALASLDETAEFNQEKFDELKQARIIPGRGIREFLARETQMHIDSSGAGTNYAAKYGTTHSGDPAGFIQNEIPNLTLTCGQVWDVSKDAIMRESDWLQKKVLASQTQAPLKAGQEELLCLSAAQKLQPDYQPAVGDRCDLVQSVGTFMLRNMIAEMPMSRAANRAQKRMLIMKGGNHPIWTDKPGSALEDALIKDNGLGGIEIRRNKETNEVEARDRAAENASGGGKEEVWRPAFVVRSDGMKDASFGFYLRFLSAELMQQVFSYALHIPYAQGVILFLIAVSYPFMAFVILVPGRAAAFMYMPLLWLWAKSWDVGFAMVIVLDKILWNILPASKVSYTQLTGSSGAPDVLRAALSVDPLFEIHAHFHFIAMAMFLVPTVTGYAILKGKKSVLSMFTDGPRSMAMETGSNAGGAEINPAINKQHAQMLSLRGRGRTNVVFGGQGEMKNVLGALGDALPAGGHLGGAPADRAATAVAIKTFANAVGSVGTGTAGRTTAATLLASGTALAPDVMKILGAEARYRADAISATDEVYGRYSKFNMQAEATVAAMDGGGGYEMERGNVAKDMMAAQLNLFNTYLEYGTAIGAKGASDALGTFGRLPGGGVLGSAARAGGVLGVGAWVASHHLHSASEADGTTNNPFSRLAGPGGFDVGLSNTPEEFFNPRVNVAEWIMLQDKLNKNGIFEPIRKNYSRDEIEVDTRSGGNWITELARLPKELREARYRELLAGSREDATSERVPELTPEELEARIQQALSDPRSADEMLNDLKTKNAALPTNSSGAGWDTGPLTHNDSLPKKKDDSWDSTIKQVKARYEKAREYLFSDAPELESPKAPTLAGVRRVPELGVARTEGSRRSEFGLGSDRRLLASEELSKLGWFDGVELNEGEAQSEFKQWWNTYMSQYLAADKIDRVFHGSKRGGSRSVVIESDGVGYEFGSAHFEQQLRPIIAEVGSQFPNVSPELVYGIIQQESSFFPIALSKQGAAGVGQFMPQMARSNLIRQGDSDWSAWDPVNGIQGTYRFLNELSEKYEGQTELMVAAYHQGETQLNQHLANLKKTHGFGSAKEIAAAYRRGQVKISDGPMTRDYVEKVTRRFQVARDRDVFDDSSGDGPMASLGF